MPWEQLVRIARSGDRAATCNALDELRQGVMIRARGTRAVDVSGDVPRPFRAGRGSASTDVLSPGKPMAASIVQPSGRPAGSGELSPWYRSPAL
jgi:hypothetical protein